MKKIIAVVMTLVMAVAFCIPSSADFMEDISGMISGLLESIGSPELPDISGLGEQLAGALDSILGGIIGGGDNEGDETTPSLPDISGITVTPEMAKTMVDYMLREGATKEDIQAVFDQLHEEGQLNDESYANLTAALAEAEVPESTAPSVPDDQVNEVAKRVIDALRQAGVKDDQMQSIVDDLYERNVIPQNVYEAITNILNAEEDTTEAESSGGIGSFFDRIKDFFGGLFGRGGDDGEGDGNGDNSNTPSGGNKNPTGFGAKEPTGDTAVTSVAAVAAVAAVAGVALMLTKKKKEQ